MSDPHVITIAAAAVAGLGMSLAAGLTGWRDWLRFKHRELTANQPEASPGASARIELADLRERIRKLEAIAAGVDL